MRMLPVDDRPSKRGLALLKEFRITPLGNSRRLEAEHGTKCQCAILADLPLRHRHEPVSGKDFVRSARATLLQNIDPRGPMKHQYPLFLRRHEHWDRSRIWFSACS